MLRPEALPFADDRDLPPVRFLEPLRVLLAEPGRGLLGAGLDLPLQAGERDGRSRTGWDLEAHQVCHRGSDLAVGEPQGADVVVRRCGSAARKVVVTAALLVHRGEVLVEHLPRDVLGPFLPEVGEAFGDELDEVGLARDAELLQVLVDLGLHAFEVDAERVHPVLGLLLGLGALGAGDVLRSLELGPGLLQIEAKLVAALDERHDVRALDHLLQARALGLG